jgi:hypothetical protein
MRQCQNSRSDIFLAERDMRQVISQMFSSDKDEKPARWLELAPHSTSIDISSR